MARASWKANVYVGPARGYVRVAAYAAYNDDKESPFKTLSNCHHEPIAQIRQCRVCGRVLGSADCEMGVKVGDSYAVFTGEERRACKAMRDGILEIDSFVSRDEFVNTDFLPHIERMFYLAPQDASDGITLGILQSAVDDMVGIGRMNMGSSSNCRDRVVAILFKERMAFTLRYKEDIRANETKATTPVDLPGLKQHVAFAKRLVNAMKDTLDMGVYYDSTATLEAQMISERQLGITTTKRIEPEPVPEVVNLLEALEQGAMAAEHKKATKKKSSTAAARKVA